MSDTNPNPSTGDQIGADIAAVGDVISPIVKDLDPAIGKGVEIAFKLLAVAEPAAYNAIASLIKGGTLTPEQQATIDQVSAKLRDNPESYFA